MHLAAPVSTAPPPSTQALCASKTIACVPAYSVGVYLFVAMKVLVLLLVLGYSQAKTVQLNYALFTATEVFDSSGAVPAIELGDSRDGMRWELVSLENFTNDNRLMSFFKEQTF